MLLPLLYVLFGISAAALVHTYVLYPLYMQQRARRLPHNATQYTQNDLLPQVSVLMAVHNEAQVIRKKMDSLLALAYPPKNIQIYIGSDCSTDATNTILESYRQQHSHLHFYPFEQRQGKPGIINHLATYCFEKTPPHPSHILLLTDASVILEADTLWHLVKHFAHPDIAIVDSNMLHYGMQKQGISFAENAYITSEVLLKHHEGRVFGKMMGPFGGCYALRSNHFTPVPPKFLVDDFFIAMSALRKNTLAINDLEAICFESVSHEMQEEYRRKARISAGNFQNLATFWHDAIPNTPLGFAFFSHKVLRWLGPFFILIAFFSSAVLAMQGNYFFRILFYVQIVVYIGIPLLDFIGKKVGLYIPIFRKITYFMYMNVALLHGFINYTKGIQSNVWKPPKRNVEQHTDTQHH